MSVDDYSGGVKGRAKQVMTLEQARKQHARQLALELDADRLPANFCDLLENILRPYCRQQLSMEATGTNGQVAAEEPDSTACRVLVRLKRHAARGCIMLGEEWQVAPADELVERLRSEFGKDQVDLKYSRPSPQTQSQ